MNFKLSLSTNNVNFSEVDLFPNQDLNYDAEFYDDKDVQGVKIPFTTDIKIPLTDANKTFFGYDPASNNASLFPSSDYFYKIEIENASNTILYGVLKVETIEYNSDAPYITVVLKDFLSRFLSDLKDLKLGDILTSTYHTTRHTIEDFNDTTANGGEAGVIGQNPDYTRIVNFPFVDLTNDVEKFGFEARQFLEYGSGQTRNGLIPTLSVSQYLKQIGSYLSTSQIPVKVKSKLFGINETEAIADFEAEKLQAVIPAKLQAKSNVNTREFLLHQRPDASTINEDMTNSTRLDGSTKDLTTAYYSGYEVFGNYGTGGTTYQKYGVKAESNVNTPSTTGELGYFAPHMSFDGRLEFRTGERFESTGTIKFEIPIIQEDKLVKVINTSSSTMKFNLCLNIYQDGFLHRRVVLNDSTGEPIVLNASDATAVQGSSTKVATSTGVSSYNHPIAVGSYVFFLYAGGPPINIADRLEWSSEDVYLPTDDQIDMSLFGDSRYGTSISVEPVSGELNIEYGTNYTQIGTGTPYRYYAASTATANFLPSDIRKAITEVVNYSDLDLRAKAIADFNPYFPDDEYIVKDSLNNTSSITPVDFVSIVCKRFGCGLFYEFDGTHHVLRIDPLHILRTNTQDGDYMLDDLKSIKLNKPLDKIKNLVVKNKNYKLFFDEVEEDTTRGDINQEINSDGVNDLTLNLKSAVYFKSLCGEVFFDTENDNLANGIVSSSEYGVTDNIMTPHDKIGVRFAFLDKPLYPTNLKVPYIIEESKRPNIYTTTQRIYKNIYEWNSLAEMGNHVFNGRLSHENLAGWSLLGEVDGVTQEYYDLISVTEQVKSKSNLNVELSIVVPTNQVGDVMFMLKKTSFSLINGQYMLIKSASGTVYEDNTYLDVKGIIE